MSYQRSIHPRAEAPRDGDWGQWLSSTSKEFDVGALQTGNTYYFRICEYLNGSCGVYSNEVSESF